MLKLYMVLLGCRAPERHTEQHDIFFGIGERLKDLVPDMKRFWPEGKANLHVDAWRTVTAVDGHSISVEAAQEGDDSRKHAQLFFVNLGGYQRGLFDERHYKILTVQQDKAAAVQLARTTDFYKQVTFKGANSHIDDHYGLDVDDIYNVRDILGPEQKARYTLRISKAEGLQEDALQLGYFKLNGLDKCE